MIKEVVQMLSFLCFSESVLCLCGNDNSSPELIPLEDQQQQLNQNLDVQIVSGQQSYGYSVWTKYQPFAEVKKLQIVEAPNNQQFMTDATQKYFIHLEQSNNNQTMTHYVELDRQVPRIKHVIQLQSTTNQLTYQHEFDYLYYEGIWVNTVVYYIADLNKVIIGFSSSGGTIIEELDWTLVLPTNMKYIIGGTGLIKDPTTGNYYQLFQFAGRMSKLILISQQLNKVGITKFMEDCKITTIQNTQTYFLIKGLYIFSSKQPIYKGPYKIEANRYKISGWLLLQSLESDEIQRETQILRITINKDVHNNQNIGDQVLLIKYSQSLVENSQEQRQVCKTEVYSYSFPDKHSQPLTNDNKKLLSIENFEIYYWQYFEFEYGRSSEPNHNSMLTIISPRNKIQQSKIWNEKIRQFTGVTMQFIIGNEDSKYIQDKSKLYDIQLTYGYENDSISAVKCHYSCKTCDGPNIYDCLTCNESSGRIFNKWTCPCKQGLVDVQDLPVCETKTQHILQEVLLTNFNLGYQKQGEIIECSFGFFQYQDKCIQCPEQILFKPLIYLPCADCLLYPLLWSRNMSCTFNQQSSYKQTFATYLSTYLDDVDITVYTPFTTINDDISIQLCEGCLSFVDDVLICKIGYYLFDQYTCKSCGIHCICSNSVCDSCVDGYSLNPISKQCDQCIGCVTCVLINFNQICTKCLDNQVLIKNNCINCGHKCEKCDATRCLYCYQNEQSNYYISSDAINCKLCLINNCQYCYEFSVGNQDISFVTLDYQFTPQINSESVQIGCAKCRVGYFQSYDNLSCIQQIQVPNCEIAIFTDKYNTVTQCLIGKQGIVVIDNCIEKPNCSRCIKNYYLADTYCMQCQVGYYADLQTGECNQCPDNCKSCIQQQKDIKDGWKWDIRAFYQYKYKNFEFKAISQNTQLYEIICIDCFQNFLLYQYKCIQGCSLDCLYCEIREGKSVCTLCTFYDLQNINTKSQENGICIQCPANCGACIPRTETEIQNYNHFSISHKSDQTYKCYESSGDSVLDNFSGSVVQCSTKNLCEINALISITIYCSLVDFENEKYKANNPIKFEQTNAFLNMTFNGTELPFISSQIALLRQSGSRNGTIQLLLHQGNAKSCLFPQGASFSSQLRHSMFTFNQLALEIVGKNVTTIEFQGSATFFNFSTVTFANLTILSSKQPVKGEQTQFEILITSYQEWTKFSLRNVVIQGQGDTQKISFRLPNTISFELSNIQFLNVSLNQYAEMFNLRGLFTDKTQRTVSYNVKNVIFSNCNFEQLVIFHISNDMQNVQYNALFVNITLNLSNFTDSSLISAISTDINSIDTITIERLTLNNVVLNKQSILINSIGMGVSMMRIFYVENSQLFNDSIFIQSSIFNINNLAIVDSFVELGTLIKSNYDSFTSSSAEFTPITLLIINILVRNVTYQGSKSFLHITQTNNIYLTLTLQNVQLIENCLSDVKLGQLLVEVVSYEQANIYFESEQLNLQNITIVRAYGHPDISLLNCNKISIYQMKVSTSEKYFNKCLHSQYSCVQMQAYVDRSMVLYIGLYETVYLTQLFFNQVISFNYPLIILESRGILESSINESISITDSTFQSNILLITQIKKSSSIIQITSGQELQITIDSVLFDGNHLNAYVDDQETEFATTLLFFSLQAIISMNNCSFINNLITNSSSSVLYIISNQLQINGSHFQGNNKISLKLIQNNLIWPTEEATITENQLFHNFPIISNGGMYY